MSPALIFTTKGDIMALNKTNQEELPFPIDGVEEEKVAEQISFDDLEFEAEYVDEDQEVKKFYTISGKESWYEPTWEKYTINDLDVGDEFEGRPEINIFENDEKSYNALRLRVMDDGEMVDLYINYPKKDFPYVKGINKGFGLENYIKANGYTKDEVLVCGDSGNDLYMFDCFPHSFAMAQSPDHFKSQANHVIKRISDLEDYLNHPEWLENDVIKRVNFQKALEKDD